MCVCMYKWIGGGGGRVAGEEEYTHIFIICLIKFDLHIKPIGKTIPPPMVFKTYRKTNRKIRESFKTIVLHLGTVNSNKERKKSNR